MAVGNVITPLVQDWVRPAEWIDISSVGNNEINLLVVDDSTILFNIQCAGTYNVDWGDGTSITGQTSGVAVQKTYSLGAGTPTSYGYNTIKIRISASGNITLYQGYRPQFPSTISNWASSTPILWAVFGTNNLTSLSAAFGDGSSLYPSLLQSVTLPPIISGITGNGLQMFANAVSLRSVVGLNSPWGAITTTQNMFIGCSSIERIDLPTTLPNTITTMQDMFNGCSALRVLNIPTDLPTGLTTTALSGTFNGCISLRSITITSWPSTITTFINTFNGCTNLITASLPSVWPSSLQSTQTMFNNCRSLKSVNLPTAWPAGFLSSLNMFQSCYSLSKLVLPSTPSNVMTNASTMFNVAYNIRDLQNTEALGSPVSGSNVSLNILTNGGGAYITGSLSFNANIGQIIISGPNALQKVGITGLRLTNTGSAFGGSSPQVNVSYSNLDTGSLQTLFTDISNTAHSGSVKTINITGANGTTGNTTNSFTYTSGSNIVNTTSGNVILPGYELTTANVLTPPMNWIQVSPQISTDRLIPDIPGCNVPNGKVGYFTGTPGSWAIAYKPYYVVNSNSSNFQISLTPGGAPIDISGSTVPAIFAYTANVVSYSGFSIVMDTVARVSTSVSSTVSPLKRIDLLARGWTVTG
jgi:hypothetical protein